MNIVMYLYTSAGIPAVTAQQEPMLIKLDICVPVAFEEGVLR